MLGVFACWLATMVITPDPCSLKAAVGIREGKLWLAAGMLVHEAHSGHSSLRAELNGRNVVYLRLHNMGGDDYSDFFPF